MNTKLLKFTKLLSLMVGEPVLRYTNVASMQGSTIVFNSYIVSKLSVEQSNLSEEDKTWLIGFIDGNPFTLQAQEVIIYS